MVIKSSLNTGSVTKDLSHTHAQPLVCVIMPIYNEAEYLPTAIESVLMQKTDFSIELLIIDDCSTDDTPKIVQSYAEKYPGIIRYVKNENNSGNAYSFWHGLTLCDADYFHVLDGDDFFISPDKLQQQVDFLQKHPGCSAVATNNLRLMPDSSISPERMPGNGNRFFTYDQVLRCEFYFHTSAYLYRNIFKENVPAYLKEEWARGDTIRTILIAKGQKIGFLDTIASVYRFNQKGIWTSMMPLEQINRTVRVFKEIRTHVLHDSREKRLFTDTIKDWEDAQIRNRYLRWLKLLSTPRRIPSRLRKAKPLQRFLQCMFKTASPINWRALNTPTPSNESHFKSVWWQRIPKQEREMIYETLLAESKP